MKRDCLLTFWNGWRDDNKGKSSWRAVERTVQMFQETFTESRISKWEPRGGVHWKMVYCGDLQGECNKNAHCVPCRSVLHPTISSSQVSTKGGDCICGKYGVTVWWSPQAPYWDGNVTVEDAGEGKAKALMSKRHQKKKEKLKPRKIEIALTKKSVLEELTHLLNCVSLLSKTLFDKDQFIKDSLSSGYAHLLKRSRWLVPNGTCYGKFFWSFDLYNKHIY